MALKEKRPETLVGLFVLIGMLALGALIVQFGSFEGNADTYSVEIEFKDASGILKGSEVRMGGAKIGSVSKTPELTDDLTVVVELSLDNRVKVYRNSEFMVKSISFIGDTMIEVVPPKVRLADAVLTDGASVRGSNSGGLAGLQSDAESIAKDARKLMADARKAMLKFDDALDEVGTVASQLSETLEKVNQGVLGEENLGNFQKSLENLEAATQGFKDLGDGLQPSAKELRAAIASVKSAADSADATFAVVQTEVKRLEPAIDELPGTLQEFRKLAVKVGEFVDNTDSTINGLSEGDGLLGTLTSDEEVSSDAKVFIKNLKKHGVLGYKDDSTYDERDPKASRYRGERR